MAVAAFVNAFESSSVSLVPDEFMSRMHFLRQFGSEVQLFCDITTKAFSLSFLFGKRSLAFALKYLSFGMGIGMGGNENRCIEIGRESE